MLLHFKELGQGPALIILHGLFGSLDNWLTLGRRFAEHRSVYLIDQRNHGRSAHSDQMNYALMAEDLKEFMSGHGIRQAAVLGHSMGGKTAMRFALDHPDMCQALMVADMAPKRYDAGHDAIFEALCSLDLSEVESRQQAEEMLGQMISDPDVRLFLLKNLSREKDGGFRWKMNLPVIREHYSEILDSVQSDFPYDGPTVFIRGGRSGYVQDSDWTDIEALFPRAKLESVKGAGHWLHAEQPDAFYDTVNRFLEEEDL